MPGEILQHFTKTRILNKPMNMQLIGDAQPQSREPRRGGGRDGNREGGRRFSDRREGGREGGRGFGGNRERGPRREDGAAPARRREY